jgi:hypothetical protein
VGWCGVRVGNGESGNRGLSHCPNDDRAGAGLHAAAAGALGSNALRMSGIGMLNTCCAVCSVALRAHGLFGGAARVLTDAAATNCRGAL